MNYYEELLYIDIVLCEIEMFAEAISLNKNGCFNHRIENTINQLLLKSINPTSFSNKILFKVNELNYNSEIKSYLIFFIESLFYPHRNSDYKIPTEIQKYLKSNNIQNDAMIEGYFKYSIANEVVDSIDEIIENENYYPFFCKNTKKLFENYIVKFSKPTDIIFIYRTMYKENYLTLEPGVFQIWFAENYPDIADFKMKSLDEIGNLSKRNLIYKQLKNEIGVK